MNSTKKCTTCESCLMPFNRDPMGDRRENPQYCSYCFKDGRLCYEGDLKGFQKICYEQMRKDGMSGIKAGFFSWMIRFAPRWRNKKGN